VEIGTMGDSLAAIFLGIPEAYAMRLKVR